MTPFQRLKKKTKPVLTNVIVNIKLNCSGLVSNTFLIKERGLAKKEVSLPEALKQNTSQSAFMASLPRTQRVKLLPCVCICSSSQQQTLTESKCH